MNGLYYRDDEMEVLGKSAQSVWLPDRQDRSAGAQHPRWSTGLLGFVAPSVFRRQSAEIRTQLLRALKFSLDVGCLCVTRASRAVRLPVRASPGWARPGRSSGLGTLPSAVATLATFETWAWQTLESWTRLNSLFGTPGFGLSDGEGKHLESS